MCVVSSSRLARSYNWRNPLLQPLKNCDLLCEGRARILPSPLGFASQDFRVIRIVRSTIVHLIDFQKRVLDRSLEAKLAPSDDKIVPLKNAFQAF